MAVGQDVGRVLENDEIAGVALSSRLYDVYLDAAPRPDDGTHDLAACPRSTY